jgi:putative secretion ATPase (PEP-CTERM system associated)
MFEQHYNLTASPFRLTPDPQFFYASETHRRAVAYLDYGLQEGEGFAVLTGDVGTGKSTVIAHLLTRLERQQVVVARFSTSRLDDHDVLRLIARSFELEPANDDKAYLLDLIGRFVAERRGRGQAVLLIVDEAQNLPLVTLEELRMLTNSGPTGLPGLQCFLVGQSNFRAVIDSPELEQLRQRVVASCHLEPLSLHETQRYIEHRLAVAGWQGRPRFADDLIPSIHEATGGVPRLINMLLGRLLLFGALEQRDSLAEADCAEVIADLEADFTASTTGPAPAAAGGNGLDRATTARLPALEARIDRLEAIMSELVDAVAVLLSRYRARNADVNADDRTN